MEVDKKYGVCEVCPIVFRLCAWCMSRRKRPKDFKEGDWHPSDEWFKWEQSEDYKARAKNILINSGQYVPTPPASDSSDSAEEVFDEEYPDEEYEERWFEEEAESADYDERESKRHKQDSDWHWKDWKGTASSSNTASASSSQWKSSDWQSGGSWKSESWKW